MTDDKIEAEKEALDNEAAIAAVKADRQWNATLGPQTRANYRSGFRDGYRACHASRDAEIAAKAPTLEGSEAKRCSDGHLPVYMHQEMQCPACSARKRADALGAEVESKDAEIADLRAKLAAMREPLWMLRSEHEAEIADLRARLEAAEARAARWVDIHDTPSFSALYDAGWRGRDGENDRKVDGRWLRLLCPPVPLPETKP